MNNFKYCPKCDCYYKYYHYCNSGVGSIKFFESNSIYGYKCPKCNGEFNYPARDEGICGDITGNPRCPFCAYPMKGLK